MSLNDKLKRLGPVELLKIKMYAVGGQLAGIIFAWVVMFFIGLWYFSVLMFFSVVFVAVEFYSVWQQYKLLKETMDKIKSMGGVEIGVKKEEFKEKV